MSGLREMRIDADILRMVESVETRDEDDLRKRAIRVLSIMLEELLEDESK